MAGLEHNVEHTRVYTPSLDSDDDLPRISTLDVTDKSYRLFSFRKEGRSWVTAVCSESSLPESEIKARAKRPRKAKHGVEEQLDKMSPPRKNAIEDLLDRTKRRDPGGDDWEIVAIDNDKPELTKRTGEVVSFSVILARAGSGRQTAKPASQERRRSSHISPSQDFALPARRGSKPYQQSPTRDKINKQSQSFRASEPILEDDPFASTDLFSADGKPMDLHGATPYASTVLPAHIPLDEPIGTKPQKLKKEKPERKSKKFKDDDIIDLDTLLPSLDTADLLVDPFDEGHPEHHSSDFDSPIETEPEDHDLKPRGRGRSDSGFASKTPKRSPTGTKPKSKAKRLSVHIPKESKYAARPVDMTPDETPRYASRPAEYAPPNKYPSRPVDVATSGRRRPQSYHGSKHSVSDIGPSGHSYSDQSVLEAEYEDCSSSGSSAVYEQERPVEWRGGYTQPDGRYQRATRDHRRGPPSPQQARFEPEPFPYGATASSGRRPRSERFASDSAVQRYYTPTTSSRPAVVTQPLDPRYESRTGYTPTQPMYNHDPGFLPYPSELRRRDSVQARDAEMYIQREIDKDREIQMLQRERDMARSERDLAMRQVEMHQEVARRASMSVKNRPSKYTHEPRLSRGYTDAYYG